MLYCKECGKRINERKQKRGRPRVFCSDACKQSNYRRPKVKVWTADALMWLHGPEFERTFNQCVNDEVPYRTKKGSTYGVIISQDGE